MIFRLLIAFIFWGSLTNIVTAQDMSILQNSQANPSLPLNQPMLDLHLDGTDDLSKQKDKETFTQLNIALKSYNISYYRAHLKDLKNYDTTDSLGNTLLHLAILTGNLFIVRETLQYPFSIRAQNHRKNTPLHFVAQMGNTAIFSEILKKGLTKEDLNIKNDQGETPLFFAIYHNRRSLIKQLYTQGVNLNVENNQGLTPLHIAAYRGLDAVLYDLIQLGAKVNAQDMDGITPLHYASGNGHKNCVSILLKNGAFIDINDKAQHPPIYNAVVEGMIEVFQILRSSKAKIHFYDENNRNLLQASLSFKRYKMSLALVPYFKEEVNHQDKEGNTALHLAIRIGATEVINALSLITDPTLVNQSLQTPLLLALQRRVNPKTLSEMLLNPKVNIDQQDAKGNALFHYAVNYNSKEVLDYLSLNSGKYDAFLKNQKGETPLILASKKGNSQAIDLYLKDPKKIFLKDQALVNIVIKNLENARFSYLARKVRKESWEYQKSQQKKIVKPPVKKKVVKTKKKSVKKPKK